MQGSRTLPWYHACRTLLSASAVNSYSTVSAIQSGPVRFNLTPCFVNHSVFRKPRILRRARRPTPLKSTTRALAQTVPPISPTGAPASEATMANFTQLHLGNNSPQHPAQKNQNKTSLSKEKALFGAGLLAVTVMSG